MWLRITEKGGAMTEFLLSSEPNHHCITSTPLCSLELESAIVKIISLSDLKHNLMLS